MMLITIVSYQIDEMLILWLVVPVQLPTTLPSTSYGAQHNYVNDAGVLPMIYRPSKRHAMMSPAAISEGTPLVYNRADGR